METTASWRARPHAWRLAPAEVHVWRAWLDAPPPVAQTLRALLSADEQARADRYKFERDRRRFVVRRGILRRLLGGYLNLPPAQLRFSYTEYGRPLLAFETQPLIFNLSHSHGLALFAFAQRPLGVDVEWIQTDMEHDEIAHRFFSPAETAVLHSLPAELKAQGFFNCWSRKEAYIKAHGKGLSIPLGSFDVALHPAQPARLLHSRYAPGDEARWTLRALDAAPGYAAALLVEGNDWQLKRWQW